MTLKRTLAGLFAITLFTTGCQDMLNAPTGTNAGLNDLNGITPQPKGSLPLGIVENEEAGSQLSPVIPGTAGSGASADLADNAKAERKTTANQTSPVPSEALAGGGAGDAVAQPELPPAPPVAEATPEATSAPTVASPEASATPEASTEPSPEP